MKQTSFRAARRAPLALAVLALIAGGPAPLARSRQAAAPAPVSAGRDAAASKWVEETLRGLTPRQRVAQLVVVAAQVEYMNFDGERFAELRRQVAEQGVGGVLVRGGSPNEVAALTNELQRLARVPLLVSADYERGLRMQMKHGTPFTTNMALGATGDTQAAYRQGKVIAEEARAVGVNWLYGPVADINNNPDNPVINIRSFGEDPRRVAEFVAAMVRGVRDGGALSTAKHFPGHGDTAVDTHIGMAAIRADRARLERVELVPFRAAIEAGVDSVMTAHVALPDVAGDSLPSTLSPKMTTGLLRGELKYDGIVVTDSLGMGAITRGYPGGEAAVRAIQAGADVALTPPDPKAAVDALEAAVKSGQLTAERVDESVRRLLAAKHRLGLARERFVDPAAVNRLVERPENVREAQRVAEASLTLLRNRGDVLPVDPARAAATLFVVVAADEDEEEGRVLIPQVQRRAKGARVLRIGPRSAAAEHEAALAEALKAERVVVAAFVKRAASKGTVALPEAQAELVRRLVATKKPLAVVAFAGPYLVRQFEDVPAYMVAYAIEEVAQAAAARAIFGETDVTGRLPVTVPGLFELGAGMRLGARK
ncbi:MAG TPA: glycoside hydrolase family 3 N-terminal domain-containing protein [Pyrinomonadaceae bacterium]